MADYTSDVSSNELDVGEVAGVLCVHALNHRAVTASILIKD